MLVRETLRPPSRVLKAVLALALGVAALVAYGAYTVLRFNFCDGLSKGDLARLTVKKYAYEAYPQWATAHPDQACPPTLFALNAYTDNRDLEDPWGNEYVMVCGPVAPAWAHGVWVLSAGEDGRLGTADDVRSDE